MLSKIKPYLVMFVVGFIAVVAHRKLESKLPAVLK